MIASIVLAAALWPANVVETCKPADNIVMAGIATNAAGDFIYCEMVSKPGEHKLQVEYTHQQKSFATKQLFYGQSLQMPDVLQQDSRTGEIRQANLTSGQVILQYQPNSHKKMAKVQIASNRADVVDAGFDNYMRQHWDELTSGKIIPVNFASIAHQKVLPLRIRAQPLATCDKLAPSGFCFVVEIDNALLRLILGNIKLLYDQQHRLQKFDGIVNLTDAKENNQSAIINYYYQSDYLPKANNLNSNP